MPSQDLRMEYLEAQAGQNPGQADYFNAMAQAYQQKLWHQLTEKLSSLCLDEFFSAGMHLIDLYENFVVKIADRLNQLAVAQFAVFASAQKSDDASKLEFLDGALKVVEGEEQASTLVNMSRARVLIRSNKAKAKELLDAGKKAIDQYAGIMDARVQSEMYRALLEYYKAYGPAADYFSNSMLYLTYTPLESIPKQQQLDLAADVSTAALIGKSIYNFGELLQHDVIKVLEGTPKAWLVTLMLAFNAGDIAAYENIMSEVKGRESVLASNESFLNEKIRVMALMELAFRRPAEQSTMPLAEVATACRVPTDQVELLLMRSFSLKVVKGVIDQVAGTVTISWVQPRVLDKEQLDTIRIRLKEWSTKVKETSEYLEGSASELL